MFPSSSAPLDENGESEAKKSRYPEIEHYVKAPNVHIAECERVVDAATVAFMSGPSFRIEIKPILYQTDANPE